MPGTGADGTAGFIFINTSAEASDVHPRELVSLNVYLPGIRPEIVTVDDEPVIPPGLIVQLSSGSPERTTLPVDTSQVGWVMVPTKGADGSALTVITAGEDGLL